MCVLAWKKCLSPKVLFGISNGSMGFQGESRADDGQQGLWYIQRVSMQRVLWMSVLLSHDIWKHMGEDSLLHFQYTAPISPRLSVFSPTARPICASRLWFRMIVMRVTSIPEEPHAVLAYPIECIFHADDSSERDDFAKKVESTASPRSSGLLW